MESHHLALLFISFNVFLNISVDSAVLSDLTPYLQPDDVIFGNYDNFPTSNSNLCARRCDGRPKICYYRFILEPYDVMGPACRSCPNVTADCLRPQCVAADGYEKAMLSVNRRYPGPAIYVCKGDRVVVDLINRMYDRAVTIHWHGIRQVGSPYMDGVPMVTQCPINGGQTFRYDYKVPIAGTFFWHSHDGLQKEDGIQGPLIVRDIEGRDFHTNQYTDDLPSHVLFISDWLRTLADERIPGLLTRNTGQMADTFLVNGKGIQATTPPTRLIPGMTPMSEFRVTRGKRYRFRFIGATCLDCAVEISIQSHRMSLITTDGGNPVQPTDISSISLLAGDRFDVVVNANQNVGTYWIFVRGLGACAGGSGINQFAILRYDGSNQQLPPNGNNPTNGPARRLNAPNSFCNASSPDAVCVSQIQGAVKPPLHIIQNSQRKNLVIQFGFYAYTVDELFAPGTYNKFYIPVVAPPNSPLLLRALINNITFAFPTSPLLSQYDDIPKDEFCPQRCYQGTGDWKNCDCFNHYTVPLKNTVNIIVTDTANYDVNGLTHPFHLHGYDFYVLEMGVFTGDHDSSLRALLNRLNTVGINNPSPPLKDTIGIPSGGYAVITIYTDNPGFWLFHCHFLYHLEMGMGAVLQTGDRSQMQAPPQGFPKCSNFKPDLMV